MLGSVYLMKQCEVYMTGKNKSPFDAFAERSKKIREENRKLTDEDIKRINDLLEESNRIDDEEEAVSVPPMAAKEIGLPINQM